MNLDPGHRNTERTTQKRRTMLTLRIEDEIFALPVNGVQEIIDPLPVTIVPNADSFVQGLINVRGSVVPVVSLRRRLDVSATKHTKNTRIVVLEVPIADELAKVALEADSVEQVIELADCAIEPVPEIGIGWPPRHLAGVAKRETGLIVLLRIESVFEPTLRPLASM
ncbi:MAG: chemotaxis protein CheW [Paracoccaceae bacterium]